MSDLAPKAGAEAEAEAEEKQAKAAEKKPLHRRFRRPPTALFVTLLGIALTAWLLPAITRQWNDRQSAHTLQAGIVSGMTAASARALQRGDALWVSVSGCNDPDPKVNILNYAEYDVPPRSEKCFDREFRRFEKTSAKIDRPWSLESAEIEARMHAYLNPQVVTAWEVFSWIMGIYDGSSGRVGLVHHGVFEFRAASRNGFNLQASAAREVGKILRDARYDGLFSYFDTDPRFEGLRTKLRSYNAWPTHVRAIPLPFGLAFADTEYRLSLFEQEIAREVLNSHVTGYSTTTHDLIHDLIP
jgi:hypothetical protein